MKTCYIVFRGVKPMVSCPPDGILCFASLHPRTPGGPTVFLSRDEALSAIKDTNRYDQSERLGWTESFGKLWISRGKIAGGER